jgi:hypothetical protein
LNPSYTRQNMATGSGMYEEWFGNIEIDLAISIRLQYLDEQFI